MKFSRNLPTQTRRDAWVEINLGALERNTRRIRQAVPSEVGLMAIVKADAYGHGAVMTIPTLEASGVSMVGVASMDEALQIRNAGLEIPVLVIGLIPEWAMSVAADSDIQLTIFAEHHLENLRHTYAQTHKPVKVHIKVDTGMHRIGVPYRDAVAFIRQCQSEPCIQLEGIFTHLAFAEDPATTRMQHSRWQDILGQIDPLPRYVHFSNSVGTLCYPEYHYNLVRLGIGFFGYGPKPEDGPGLNLVPGLEPVMGLKARIIHLQDVPPGEGISYCYRFRTKTDGISRIATLPLGYADGVPRILTNRIEGLLHGKRVPQVGAITMDQMMFDVSAVPDAMVGEAVTIIGEEEGHTISLTDWAQKANTIEYELMCGLRVRLPKTYTRH